MKNKRQLSPPLSHLVIAFLLMLIVQGAVFAQSDSIDYFGQKAPGYYPEKFAEGILIGGYEYIANFSPDGKEFYFPTASNDEYTIGMSPMIG